MISTIWSSSDASEILFLVALIVAAVAVVLDLARQTFPGAAALVPAAIGLTAAGLLAL